MAVALRPLLATSPLLALLLAGCLAPAAPLEPSPPLVPDPLGVLHEVADVQAFEVPGPDGTALRGHVYLPDGPGPFATVLIFSPYWDNLSPPTGDLLVEKGGRRLVAGAVQENLTLAGFAIALASLRGTGGSDGCFEFMNPADGPDASAVIAWLAAQPWSNGNVGMYGGSYAGWSQDVTLRDPPPALKAVVPYSSVQDLWSLVTFHGAPRTFVPLIGPDWTLGTGLGTFAAAGPVVNGRLVRADARVDNLRPDHVCPSSATSNADLAAVMADGDMNPWYEARDNRPGIAASTVPTYVVHGLTDGEGHIAQLDGRWALSPAPQRWLIGQWGHSAHLTVVEDFPWRMVAWFHEHLRGGPTTLAPGVVEYQDDEEAWHEAAAWPPPGADAVLHLDGAALSPGPPRGSAPPQRFVAADLGAPNLDYCLADQVVYVSPPLAEGALLAGHFTLNLTLASTAPDANVVAYLFRTSGSGACPDPDAREIRRALTDLRHRGHLEQGTDFPVGAPENVTLLSSPFASPVRAGERLALAIAGGSFQLQPKATKAALTVEAGTLELRVAGGALRFASSGEASDAAPRAAAAPDLHLR